MSFGAAADAAVHQDSQTSNFGTAASMDVRSGSGSVKRRAYVSFDLSSIPPASTIDSATLTLCATAVPATTRTYDAYRVSAAWGESTITWSNQPAVEATASASATTPAAPGCISWTVTADVQAWVGGTASNFGWRLRDSSEGTGPHLSTFRSREDTALPSEQPTLQLTYTAP